MANITVTTNQQVIEVTESGGVDVTNTTDTITILPSGTLIIQGPDTYSINASTVAGGANLNLLNSNGTNDAVKIASGTGITVSRTDADTITVTNTSPAGTTYTQNASATTGGANLNLVGSDSTTDTVKFASGTNVTVSRTDADTISIASTDTNTTYTIASASTTGGANLNLVGSDSSTDSVAYKGAGATTVTSTDANTVTITSTDTNTTYTQNASSTSGGANLNLVGSDSTTDSIKLASGTNVTVTRTDADTVTFSSTDTNTTYTQNISSTSGGANLNLVGSDSTTDTVKFANGTGVTVAFTDASIATVSIGQSVGTGDSPSFAGITGGNITVGVATDNTISTTTGDLILSSATGFVTVPSLVIDNIASIDTATITTTATTTVPLITTTRNVMNVLVYIVQGANVHCVNATVLETSASTAMLTTYGEMYNTTPLANFTADTSGGAIRLLITPTSATSTVFSAVRTSLT